MAIKDKPNTTQFRDLALSYVGKVLNQRGADYEDGKEDNFEHIATVLTIVLRDILGPGCKVTGRHVAKIFESLKLVRDNTPYDAMSDSAQLDNPADGAGYGVLWLAHQLSCMTLAQRQDLCAKWNLDMELAE